MRVLKNVFFIWLIGLFLTGCSLKDYMKSDRNFIFSDANGTVMYNFKGENLYEDGKDLGEYEIVGKNERFLATNKSQTFTLKNLDKSSKYMKFYMFSNEIASIVELKNEKGICAAYANGENVSFQVTSNTYIDEHWITCGGVMRKNGHDIEKMVSKSLLKIPKDNTKEVVVENFALAIYCSGMIRTALRELLEKNYCSLAN